MYIEGIKVDLNEQEIKEALNWGEKNKFSVEKILETYHFGAEESYEEHGIIFTKFHGLAVLGAESARKYSSPDLSKIDKILHREKLGITIFAYGDRLGFAAEYHIVIKQGAKIIQPTEVEAPEGAMIEPRALGTPAVETPVTAGFRYSDIALKGKTTIVLIREKDELSFDVDFSNYR